MPDHMSQIAKSELFDSLSADDLSKIMPVCSGYEAEEGRVLFTEGSIASHIYIVVEGRIALQKSIRVPHGTHLRRTTVSVCGPGEVVGWSALVEPREYTLSAITWEPSRVIEIEAKLLQQNLDPFPEIGYRIMRSLSTVVSRRLRLTTAALTYEREVVFAGTKL